MEYPIIANTSLTGAYSNVFLNHPGVVITYVSFLSIASLVGTLGNFLVLASVGILMSKRHTVVNGYSFICNLACSDLLVTAVVNPFAILGVMYGDDIYSGRFALCRFLGSLCVISCVVSLLSIGCIAFNRYLYICHHNLHCSKATHRKCIVLCVMTWVIGVVLDLPSHVSWSRHAFDTKTHKCIFDREYNYYYTVFFVSTGMLLPLGGITVMYLRIFIKVSSTKKHIGLSFHHSMHEMIFKALQQTKMMFAVFTAFLICWTPYVFVLLMDRHDTFSLQTHLFTSMTAHMHASTNFMIYGICNKRIRSAYKLVIYSHICRRATISLNPFSSDGHHLGRHERSRIVNNPDTRDQNQPILSCSTPSPQAAPKIEYIAIEQQLETISKDNIPMRSTPAPNTIMNHEPLISSN